MIGLDIILGAVTGLIGNVVTGVMNYKTMKIKLTHEEKMIGLQTDAMKEKAKMQIEITKNKIKGELDLADMEVYGKSQEAGNKPMFSEKWIEKLFTVTGWVKYFAIPFAVLMASAFAFVDFLRGFMRPGITMYLTGLTTAITYMAWDILQTHGVEGMSVTESMGIYDRVITIVIYLTVSCVTWWFADRRTAKFLQTLNKKGGSNEGM